MYDQRYVFVETEIKGRSYDELMRETDEKLGTLLSRKAGDNTADADYEQLYEKWWADEGKASFEAYAKRGEDTE